MKLSAKDLEPDIFRLTGKILKRQFSLKPYCLAETLKGTSCYNFAHEKYGWHCHVHKKLPRQEKMTSTMALMKRIPESKSSAFV